MLGSDALGIGIFVHLRGEVRSDGDYGITGFATEIPALPSHPVFGVAHRLWGDPSAEAHDGNRGSCVRLPMK